MTASRAKLSPLLRSLAVMSLLVWVAAVTVCSTDCLCFHCETEHAEQASTAAGQSHDSDKDCNHDDSFCVSLHSFAPTFASSVLAKPDFGLAFATDFISTAQSVKVAQPETSVSRQPPSSDWVFRPEVSLGAAFRSHAPPVLL